MSETRLIDANALQFLKWEIEGEEGHGIEMCIKAVEDAPTIPAQPVKRGHWINHFDDLFPEESTIECSVCHEHSPDDMPYDNFCPNCGSYNGGE